MTDDYIDIPINVSLFRTGMLDVPIQTSLYSSSSKDVPISASLIVGRTDIGLYGDSSLDSAPRSTILFLQGGTPDHLIAPTDPYWLLKSGNTETGKEGFLEIGIGQSTTYDQSDTNLTGFIRVQQDVTSGEGEVKIKPSLWFYPSTEPTTPQEGMLYYNSSTHSFYFYNGSRWDMIAADSSGGGTQWVLPVWDTTSSLGDSMISQNSGGTLLTIDGDVTISGGNIGIGIAVDAGYLIESIDDDVYSRFGRTLIGNANLSDYAAFSHRDMTAVTEYAIIQSATGQTIINSASGKTLSLRINNVNVLEIDTSQNATFAGDVTLQSGGSIISSGPINIKVSGDTDDYLQFYITGDRPSIKSIGYNMLLLESDDATFCGAVAWDSASDGLYMRFHKTSRYGEVTSTGPLRLGADGDTTDYIELTTTTDVPKMKLIGGSDFQIDTDGGNIALLQDTVVTGDLTVSGGDFFGNISARGRWVFDIDSGNSKFYISRTGALTQALEVYIDDLVLYFRYDQDETDASIHAIEWNIDSQATGNHYYDWQIDGTSVLKVESDGDITFTGQNNGSTNETLCGCCYCCYIG